MISKTISYLKRWINNRNNIQRGASIGPRAKLRGNNISKTSSIGARSVVTASQLHGTVIIGDKNIIDNVVFKGEIATGRGCRLYKCEIVGNVTIGNYTSVWGPNLDITGNKDFQVTIGSFCSIARNVTIQTFNHNHRRATTYFIGKNYFNERWSGEKTGKGGVNIENDVWIGSHCVILSGVRISNGAVVAANSVVTSDVPPYAIVAGSPAKVIGYRFEEAVVKKMLELRWWEWPSAVLAANKAFFREDVTEELVNRYLRDAK